MDKYSALAFHDLKNLLQAPLMRVGLLKRRLGKLDPGALDDLTVLERDLFRAQQFLIEVNFLAGASPQQPENISSKELFEKVRLLLGETGTSVVFHESSGARTVRGKALLIRAVFYAVRTMALGAASDDPKVSVSWEGEAITIKARGIVGTLGTTIIHRYLEVLGGEARFAVSDDESVLTLSFS